MSVSAMVARLFCARLVTIFPRRLGFAQLEAATGVGCSDASRKSVSCCEYVAFRHRRLTIGAGGKSVRGSDAGGLFIAGCNLPA